MRHLFSTRLRVVLIVAVLLSAGLAILSNATGHTLPDMIVHGLLSPFRYGAQALTSSAEQFYSYMFRYETLAAENEALKEQIAQMESDARQADAYQRENQRLRNLLDLSSVREDFKLVDGYIIAKSSTDWSSTITINKGTNAGINKDMCVVTANHEVVGLVVDVGPDYAVIKTILDSSLEVSATIASSGYSGMVKGGYIPGSYAILLFTASDLASITNHIHNWVFFFFFGFGSIPSFFLELFLHRSPVAYWTPTDLGSSSFSILSFCVFILFMQISRQEYRNGWPFPSPVDYILSDLSTMTRPTWKAPQGLA